MKAAMFAHDMLLAGTHEIMVAGGMESMTNAPYLLLKGRGGYRMGHDKVYDHMMLDGLEDAYEARPLDGHLRRGLRRQVQVHARGAGRVRDRHRSRARKKATESGAFAAEITPVTVKDRAGETRDHHRRRPGQGQARQDPARSSPRSRRTARSPPPRRRRSTTAPRRWC